MIVLAYLGSQCTKFHVVAGLFWFFTAFCLESCIGPDAISLWIRQGKAADFVKISENVRRKAWQWLDNSPRPKKRRNRWRATSKACSSFYFTKNWSWQAKEAIPHTPVTFYSDYVKMCEDLAPNFGDKKLLHHDNSPSHISFFTREFLTEKQHGCRPPATLLFSVSPIEDKTEMLPYWHNWGDRGRVAGGAEHPQCLHPGRWWPLGRKLIFDKMAAPVP
jgi:hypothetical protein